MEEVGIRRIKASLSYYINRVKQGQTSVITDRGAPVAKLVPFGEKVPSKIALLMAKGLASWNGGKPHGIKNELPVNKGQAMLSSFVFVEEDRR